MKGTLNEIDIEVMDEYSKQVDVEKEKVMDEFFEFDIKEEKHETDEEVKEKYLECDIKEEKPSEASGPVNSILEPVNNYPKTINDTYPQEQYTIDSDAVKIVSDYYITLKEECQQSSSEADTTTGEITKIKENQIIPTRDSQVTDHKRVNSGEKSFSCIQCDK